VFRIEDANGYLVYRVDSRQALPLDSVKAEISQEIFRRKMDEKTKELNAPVHTTYNEQYFGPPVPAGTSAGQQTPPSTPK
jgi:hypothetical protein